MAALATTPATKDAAVTLFFREKAFWQFGAASGLADMRRLVRQYWRTQDQVFPSGTFHKGGDLRDRRELPGDGHREDEPEFPGCIDRKA